MLAGPLLQPHFYFFFSLTKKGPPSLSAA
uniref:Uncharacterized protein n=1 Tax=Nelumbo nucifera TaxID=4432 RepID=A0A822ZZ20_NELNU|nr:TPA_asm: hypothetical protein HUJ06_018708 [Nelumbo nucifera]